MNWGVQSEMEGSFARLSEGDIMAEASNGGNLEKNIGKDFL